MLPMRRHRPPSDWDDLPMPSSWEHWFRPWLERSSLEVGEYPVDIDEDDQAVYVNAELPGFRKEEIQVTAERDRIHIVAERKAETPKGKRHLTERRHLRIERVLSLPATIDPAQIEAHLEDGVLRIKMAKSEKTERHLVEIK